jgi:uncharacterized protein DUF2510
MLSARTAASYIHPSGACTSLAVVTEAGWQADPSGAASYRWWDGSAWTDHTAPGYELGLRPVRDVIGQSLLLHQVSSGSDRLMAGEAEVGRLDKPFVGEITGHSAEGSWKFDRQGLTQNNVSIRALPLDAEIARFAWEGIGTGTDGALSFGDGRSVALRKTESLELRPLRGDFGSAVPTDGAWTFVRSDGVPLVTSRLAWPPPKTKKIFGKEFTYTTSRSGTGRTSSNVWTDVHPDASSVVELPLLVLLGTFLTWWTASMRESVHRGGL